jgi:hypothetical protein
LAVPVAYATGTGDSVAGVSLSLCQGCRAFCCAEFGFASPLTSLSILFIVSSPQFAEYTNSRYDTAFCPFVPVFLLTVNAIMKVYE